MNSSIPATAVAIVKKAKTAALTKSQSSVVKSRGTHVTKKLASSESCTKAPANLVREGHNGPDPVLMKKQSWFVNCLMDYYFRLEIGGWENLPKQGSLLIGGHSGGPLTMDAWTIAYAWWRHFQGSRSLHGTAHDVLMNAPGLGRYFRRCGVISPTRENIEATLEKGDDVILWPGGEQDAFRSWNKRDKVVLGERSGFIRLAIRTGTPIVPVATVGGHDTLFVLSEGRGLAKLLHLKKLLRMDV